MRRRQHVRGEAQNGKGMVLPGLRQTGGRHVGIADGLDLLEPMGEGEIIEIGEEPVQQRHHFGRFGAGGDPGEVHDVGEQHRHALVAVCDRS